MGRVAKLPRKKLLTGFKIAFACSPRATVTMVVVFDHRRIATGQATIDGKGNVVLHAIPAGLRKAKKGKTVTLTIRATAPGLAPVGTTLRPKLS